MRTAFALTLLTVFTLTVAVVAGPPLPTEPAAPPPPEKYDVTIRYSIPNPSHDRVEIFKKMLAFIKKQGFTRDEDRAPEDEEENPAYAIMSGTIPSATARRLLLESHIRSLRLVPAGSAPPAADAPVRVQLELAAGPLTDPGRYLYPTSEIRQREMNGGPLLARQRVFADQAPRGAGNTQVQRSHRLRPPGARACSARSRLVSSTPFSPICGLSRLRGSCPTIRPSTAFCSPACEITAAARLSWKASSATGTPILRRKRVRPTIAPRMT